MSYTQVFGGNTIYPSDVSYLSLALSANVELEWPLESAAGVNIAARIIDVTPSAAGYYVDMPDATLTGAGQVILFNNVGSYTFYVRDFSNNIIATVASGEQWELYLAATTTAAGTWRVFRFGASTATVQPSALAGPGLTVDGSQLAQSTPVITFSTSGETLATSNRASAWVWIGTGTGTLNLPSTVTVGNNYFVMVRNSGGGDLVIDPTGAQTINGLATFTLRPGDSATLITDGTEWYTIGFGQDAVFAFDYTIVTIPSGGSTPATFPLTGSNLNRIAYRFEGALGQNCTVIVPSTIQQYWVTNATTGAYTLSLNTASGTAVTVAQNARGIYYCDGTNVVLADTASISLPLGVAQGGTGGTTTSAARLGIGITPFADPIVTATSGASVRSTIGAAASGANSDITSLTGLTTPLSAPQGGTGATTLTGVLKGNGTSAFTAATAGTDYVAPSGALGTPSSGTLSNCTVDGTNAVGFKKVPQSGSDKTTSYTLATSDVGKFIGVGTSGSITIPDATFATGDIISLFNNTSGNITITCTITTAYIGGVNTDKATMTLATRGVATVLFISGTVCVVNGNVS
jgi:hypothetical protein